MSDFKVGDAVRWNGHGGEVEGKVVEVAFEDGEIEGFHYRASQEDPRYIVETEDGKRAAHTAGALSER